MGAVTTFWNRLGLDRKELRAWALYDCGNSAFATTVMAAVLPTYFADVAAANLAPHLRTAYWGYIASLALAIATLMSPSLGIMADQARAKKKYLRWSTIVGAVASMSLYLVTEGDWVWAAIAFVVGDIAFSAANIFYESLLPHIASRREIHRVSTAGYAIGYLGGGVLLAINLAWIMMPEKFGIPDKGMAVRLSFISVGIWWLWFTIPLLRHVPEPTNGQALEPLASFGQRLLGSLSSLAHTLRGFRQYRQAFIFLLAFWIYNDGIGTIIKMATIYGKEVGIGTTDLIGAILLVQFIGVPFSFLFGLLADRIGTKTGLYLSLTIYLLITILAFYMQHAWQFWILALGVGMVQGGSQALSRSMFATMVPKQRSAEFFGFFSVSSKFAGIFGPLMFGLIGQMTGGSRLSILAVALFFLVGMILLRFVDWEQGQKEAMAGE